MTKEQINKLILEGEFPENAGRPNLIETHISWVLVCDRYVYKIKKPIQYSFLDFSTVQKRKYFCEREVQLNKRLTDNIYLDVLPVKEISGRLLMDGEAGDIIDYAVRMRKVDRDRQMDVLLVNNKVTATDIRNLAERIAAFHKNTDIVYKKNFLDVQEMFNDLGTEKDFLHEYLNKDTYTIISQAIDTSNAFMESNKKLLGDRLKAGFFRDCHGDLHTRNIFLLPSPQPFDCLEFNDDYRQIDVLNEVAFLCMDLDAFGRQDLSDLFIADYNKLFPSMRTDEERRLFVYYKGYRSNIRAKVNSLRAREAGNDADRKLPLAEAEKYLRLMDGYMKLLEGK